MSYELDYFPPEPFNKNGWGSKPLNYSPWRKYLYSESPARISLEVDLFEGVYHWSVEVTDWNYKHTRYIGTTMTAVEACEKAEQIGNELLKLLTPNWVISALKNKWRPPAIVSTYSGSMLRDVIIIEMN